ncbi:hypothetical protein [Thiocystis minor]|uniref:hypothetical protein n=1 Tax=Thiocystis minor TaxID=61597 RepID=UPI0019136E52|nr:hypothetical protein [Thiocystis minor]
MSASPATLVKLSTSADWSDAELLAEGFAVNPKTLRALQRACRFSDQQAASACLVSLRTYRRWLASGNPDPTALRLLSILAGYVPWSGWAGWEVHNGYLFPPGYSRGGIPPAEFFALVFYRQQVSVYQEVNATLKARVAALESSADAGARQAADRALSMQLQALAGQVQALGSELAALGARTCNTGTLSHG